MERAEKRIPANVQFVCVVAKLSATASGDGFVSCVSQWTTDLQKQGIPAVLFKGSHLGVVAMRKSRTSWPASFANDSSAGLRIGSKGQEGNLGK